jgi:hypothetical protein
MYTETKVQTDVVFILLLMYQQATVFYVPHCLVSFFNDPIFLAYLRQQARCNLPLCTSYSCDAECNLAARASYVQVAVLTQCNRSSWCYVTCGRKEWTLSVHKGFSLVSCCVKNSQLIAALQFLKFKELPVNCSITVLKINNLGTTDLPQKQAVSHWGLFSLRGKRLIFCSCTEHIVGYTWKYLELNWLN